MLKNLFARRAAWVGMLSLLLLACGMATAKKTPVAANAGYAYYSIGDVEAKRPAPVQPGLMLVGGGEWPYDAFHWMIEKAGHGHIVILSASGADEEQEVFFKKLGGVVSAQTLVFSDRRAASDPKVLDIVRKADGIFFAGGDQSHYVDYWKGTPLNKVLDEHARAGKPMGGTSAGLAILGAYSYGALDGGSVVSDTALKNPMSSEVTLVENFLHLPYLDKVITDSHFGKRERLGRLIAFLARLSNEQRRTDLVGIGVDENTALCIDGDGLGKLFTGSGGHAWLVRPQRQADLFVAGKPLTFKDIPVVGIGTGSVLHLDDFTVDKPDFVSTYEVDAGSLSKRK